NTFPRLRIGIRRSDNSNIKGKDYVLGIPRNDERILLEIGEDRAVEAIELVIRQGISTTMNVVNVDPEEAARKKAEREQRQKERQEQARLKREAKLRAQETAPPQGDRKDMPLLYTTPSEDGSESTS